VGDFEMTKSTVIIISAILVFSGLLAGCATVSFDQPKSYSTAITDTEDTPLGKYAARKTKQHNGLSSFYPLIRAWTHWV
jgi:ABC-type phosphate transport system substrate-binding protein